MGLNYSPKIVTDQLIFAYDQANIKSYRGPAIQNLAAPISIAGTGTATGYSSSALIETVDIPQLGVSTVYTNIIQNNYLSFSPNSGNCCPALHQWGSFAVSPSTLYTYGIVYKCNSGYTHPNYMYRYEYTANGGSYVTEAGVHNDANRVSLGSGWYYAWGTFTTAATTNWIQSASPFYYRYSNVLDRLSVAKVLVAAGNWSGLPPQYWPNQATNRTTTQAIVDQTGRSTTVAGALTYNSDGTFDFNYASPSYVSVPLATAFNKTAGTINLWLYPTRYNGGNGYFVNREDATPNALDWLWIGPYSDNFYFRIGNGSDCCSNDLSFGSVSTVIPLNTWVNMCFTWASGGSSKIYKNGVLYTSRTISSIPNTSPAVNGRFGLGHANADNYYNGKMPIAQIYNRELTDAEILSNFNAIRGRYRI